MWRIAGLALIPQIALAESLVATRTIRPGTIIEATDVTLVDAEISGAVSDIATALGQEARVAIYPGRPVRAADFGPPATVERNQRVPIAFLAGGLRIRSEGRALGRGGVGDVIAVMNLVSRSIVSGRIAPDGTVLVGPDP